MHVATDGEVCWRFLVGGIVLNQSKIYCIAFIIVKKRVDRKEWRVESGEWRVGRRVKCVRLEMKEGAECGPRRHRPRSARRRVAYVV
jgi:hypothetical protein